jgi:hypothetical protein
MRTDDRSYFIRRAAEERAAAEIATCPRAAEAHREMAERYDALIDVPTKEAKAATA